MLLLLHTKKKSVVTEIFADRMTDALFWADPKGLDVMRMLLATGASSLPVSKALITSITHYDLETNAQPFAELLLESGANFNYKKGLALRIAIEKSADSLIQNILGRDCGRETLILAIPFIIRSQWEEGKVAALVKDFASHPKQRFDEDFTLLTSEAPMVMQCMRYYGGSRAILAAVLDAGFPVDEVYEDRTSGKVTPLFWALACLDGEESTVDDSVIFLLIKRGGKLTHTNSLDVTKLPSTARLHRHPTPLIHGAVEHGRHEVADYLIENKIELEVKDEQGFREERHCPTQLRLAIMQAFPPYWGRELRLTTTLFILRRGACDRKSSPPLCKAVTTQINPPPLKVDELH
jgi:ankyrin repeat protein